MRARIVARWPADWGLASSCVLGVVCLAALKAHPAGADPAARPDADRGEPTLPDPPARRGSERGPPVVGPSQIPPLADLDGLYVWLGPLGAGGLLEGTWDSTFGADLSVVRVREAGALGAVGATAGAARWTERGGFRVWLDGVIGTRLGGRMYGLTVGAIAELPETAHPRLGGSVGVWGFFGVTPFARVGTVAEAGVFAEIGLHIALPVLRF